MSNLHTTVIEFVCNERYKWSTNVRDTIFQNEMPTSFGHPVSSHFWRCRSRPSEHRLRVGHHWQLNGMRDAAMIHSLQFFIILHAAATRPHTSCIRTMASKTIQNRMQSSFTAATHFAVNKNAYNNYSQQRQLHCIKQLIKLPIHVKCKLEPQPCGQKTKALNMEQALPEQCKQMVATTNSQRWSQ